MYRRIDTLGRSVPLVLVVILSVASASTPFVLAQVDPVSGLVVGGLIAEAEDAIDRLVDEALERFDQSALHVAIQARSILNQASRALLEATNLTFEQLDAQQRRAYSDVQALTESISNALRDDVQDIVEPIQHNVFLLAGRTGYVVVGGGQALRGEESLELTLQGSALSRARIRDFRVAGVTVTPDDRGRDDARIALSVSLEEGRAAELVEASGVEDVPVEIPISFSLKDCWLFDLFCFNERPFSVVARVLPSTVGSVKAAFVGEVTVLRRSGKRVGPFSGGRVRSRIRVFPPDIRRGKRTDYFRVEPDSGGWRIDIESGQIEMTAFRECSGHSASFSEISEQGLTVKVISQTVGEPWVNCKVDVWIEFEQVLVDVGTSVVETEEVPLEVGRRTVLRLGDEVELAKPRLAHVEVESPLISGGRAIVRRGERRFGLTVEEEAVSGRGVYVEVDWAPR